jgi:hypothetical protein
MLTPQCIRAFISVRIWEIRPFSFFYFLSFIGVVFHLLFSPIFYLHALHHLVAILIPKSYNLRRGFQKLDSPWACGEDFSLQEL